MGVINCLSKDIYDKIAAGEVVERPASVIKELVENSIDAGADKITVEIKKGGSVYMSVADNGCGMEREDAEIAFLCHATSKISSVDDLDAIYTMGFRGEALSSIAAVSEAELSTKRREDETGTSVTCSGGEICDIKEVGRTDGTTFVVKNLFFNVPARMKFLKKDATEAAYISNIVIKFILSHPEISFKFINNGKEQLFSPGDNLIVSSIYSVYGKNYAKSAIEFDNEYDGIRIYGVAGKGDTARPNRDYQSCFVNRRYVKSPLILKAVEEAYKNQVMTGKFPMAVINIEIDPSMIDINVHPTKQEVKFSDESLVYKAVYNSVKEALYSVSNIPKIEMREEKKNDEAFASVWGGKTQYSGAGGESKAHFEYPEKSKSELFVREGNVSAEKPRRPYEKITAYNTETKELSFFKKHEETAEAEVIQTAEESAKGIFKEQRREPLKNAEIAPKSESVSSAQEQIAEQTEDKPVKEKIEIRIIGQVFNTYILAEAKDEMLIIDQHAAHERLMYEKLKKDIAEKKVVSQGILVPVVVNLSPTEYAAFGEHKEQIDAMGFETEDFGGDAIVIRSTPYDIDSGDLEDLMIGIITSFAENKNEIITEKQDKLLYTIACKAAVKANHALSPEEQKNLAERVLDFDNINTCPHGRPITISMTKKELEKLFKRIV